MADLTRRPGNRPSRRDREQRAYRLVQAGGTAATVAVITGVLAILQVIGFGIPLVAAVIAVVCLVLFRQTVARR